ncbi:hypothetical protein CEXT_764851 [Caerostris extrusa]|uniref:Uncharacterized protein n=1 Tax=Caerostris extrusa TaxID=172846 RepID=A0AAV4XKP3_CAEEX|nr:hypothetical protein CEXT_764851 [Caerostris extrusa]
MYLEPSETVNTILYSQRMIILSHALIEKQPEWLLRHIDAILQCDITLLYTAKEAKHHFCTCWELLPQTLTS